MQIDDNNNLRIVKDVHISWKVTSNVFDKLIKTSTPSLNETHVHEENISDIQDALIE